MLNKYQKNIISINKRYYHKHLNWANYLTVACKQLSRQMVEFPEFDEESLAYEFRHLDMMISHSINHEKSFNLLDKVYNGKEINKDDYNNELLDFIERHKKFNFSSKDVYDKFEIFKASIKSNE